MENLPRGIRQFLVRAKRATNHAKESLEDTAQHNVHYEEDDGWRYVNAFVGKQRLSGQETVWKDGQPVWAMNYLCRVTGEGFSSAFLCDALAQMQPDAPYRGPIEYQQGPLLYCNMHGGDLGWFYGREEMFASGVSVYECLYHGGAIE